MAGAASWPERWAGRLFREEVLLPPIRKRIFRKRMEAIAAGQDVLIDFDMSLARFARPQGKRLLGVSHFSLAHRLARDRRKYRTAARYFPRYDAIVTLCHAMRDEGRALFPALAGRLVTLYPGYHRADMERRASAALEPAPAAPYIVSVARLDESQKDFSTLLRAYAELVRDGGVEATLIIVGDGRDRLRLQALARGLGIGARVTFAGYTPNPLPWIARARLLVLSSKYEGLPTVLIEGLVLGQVLVSSDCPTGPREILDDGRAGLLVPVRDPSRLASAMRRALLDRELRKSLRARAVEHSATFDVQAFRERFEALVPGG